MRATAQIKTTFYLSSDEFDLNAVTSKIGINPTKTRTKDNFPLKAPAYTVWAYRIVENNCVAVSIPFEKLIGLLEGKEELIISICKEHCLEANFEVIVHMQDGNHPEILLTPNIMAFAAKINAEIGFDIYEDL